MIRMSKLFCAALLIVSCVCSVYAVEPGNEKSQMLSVPSVISDSLPWFAVRENGGNNIPFTKIHLQKMAQESDRVVLVYFATWCIPCREGVSRLVENKQELENHKVKIVFVNAGERDEELVGKWVEKMGVGEFKVVMDIFGRMTEMFGLVKESAQMDLPKTLVLDKALKPMFLIGREGSDYPQVIWKQTVK